MLVLSFYNHIDHNKRTSLDGLPVISTKKGIQVLCDTIESTHVSKYKGPIKALPGKEWKRHINCKKNRLINLIIDTL